MNEGTPRRGATDLARLEKELLTRLGLGSDATPEQVEAAHDAVVAFVASAPRALRGWARSQAAAADEAYALLSDPIALARSASVGSVSSRARTAPAEPPAPPPVIAPPASRVARPRRRAGDPYVSTVSDDELDDLIAAVTPSAHRDEVDHPRVASGSAGRGGAPGRPARRWFGRPVLALGAVAAAVVIGFVVYNAGGPATIAASNATPSASASPVLDETQVSALMAKITENPKDVDALMGLGDAFFQAGQYDVATTWLAKLVAIDPKNVRALLALGAAEFNAADPAGAETHWKQVVTLDAKNVEAHYDLGFLYLQQQPPDLAGVRREWQLVVDLAPGSEVAQNVQAHLDAIASPGAATSPGASAIPAGSASPAAAPTAPVSRPTASAQP